MKKLLLVIFIFSLMSLVCVTFKIHIVKASGTIYIRADGSIEGTDKIQRSGDIYSFINNINDSVVIERNNTVILGDGYTLQGDGSAPGFTLSGINNVTIQNTNIKNFSSGLRLVLSSYCTISGNNITANNYGVLLDESSEYNSISGNNITASSRGVYLGEGCWNNNIYENNIINNNLGMRFLHSSHSRLYHNNFINNASEAAFDESSPNNIWDDGVEGNYWSNYDGTDSDPDGIGDSSHQIYEYNKENIDNYPLMGMFSSFNVSLGYHVTVISNSTVEDFVYFESNSTIRMNVSNMTANQAFGFCRMCIPHALMNATYHVIINGTDPWYWNYTLYDNGENGWIYFSYQHSTLEIVIVPEFPSFLMLPLFMIATLLMVTVYRRKDHILS